MVGQLLPLESDSSLLGTADVMQMIPRRTTVDDIREEYRDEEFYFDFERKLSYGACFVVELFIDPIEDVLSTFPNLELKYGTNGSGLTLLDAKRFLRKSLGWKHEKIEKTVREIKIFLKSRNLWYANNKKEVTQMAKRKSTAKATKKKAVAKKAVAPKIPEGLERVAKALNVKLTGSDGNEHRDQLLDVVYKMDEDEYEKLPQYVHDWATAADAVRKSMDKEAADAGEKKVTKAKGKKKKAVQKKNMKEAAVSPNGNPFKQGSKYAFVFDCLSKKPHTIEDLSKILTKKYGEKTGKKGNVSVYVKTIGTKTGRLTGDSKEGFQIAAS